MMLRHLGEATAAQRVEAAVARVAERGETLTLDLGGSATTEEVADAVIAALSS
jgi:isocitrate dehydrogenase (NAD+)